MMRFYWILIGLLSIASAEDSLNFAQNVQKLFYNDGVLYVGGTRKIYKVNGTALTLTSSVSTIRTIACPDGQCPTSDADDLVRHIGPYGTNGVIVCTTHYSHCEVRHLSNLSIISVSPAYLFTNISIGGSVAIFVADAVEEEEAVWIGTSYFTNKTETLAVAARFPSMGFNIKINDLGDFWNTIYVPSGRVYDTHSPRFSLSVEYIYAFSYLNFRFFVKTKPGKSIIGGVCSNDVLFSTYIEFDLECTNQSPNQVRHVIQAAFLGDQTTDSGTQKVLYAIFGDSATSTDTSLCLFPASQLVDKLQQSYERCHRDGDSVTIEMGTTELKQIFLDPSSCKKVNKIEVD